MTTETEWRPGPYPTLYACRYCKAVVKKKDVFTGQAKALDATTCVCPACLPRWTEQQKRRAHQRPVAQNESFVALVAAAQDDRTVRDRILALARLDAFNRESMLNTMLAELRLQGAPAELIGCLALLQDDDIAIRVCEVLGND